MSVAIIGPKFYGWGKDGKPLAFGKLYTYHARTNTPKPTYQSEDQVVENTNPVIMNGEGYANIYLDGSYKVVLKDSDDNEIWSADPVTSSQAEEWIDCYSAIYLSASSFKIDGNVTSQYSEGRIVQVDSNASDYAYSGIQSSSYSGGSTTIVLTNPIVTTGVVATCVSFVSPDATIEHNALKGRNYSGAHEASAINTSSAKSVQESLDNLPEEYDPKGEADTKIATHNNDTAAHPEMLSVHNNDATAHPALSAFITSEADRAEAAADAAALNADIYADTTAGLAATVDGQYFSTVSAESDEYLILYLNNVGVAVLQKIYPSTEVVSQLEALTRGSIFDTERVIGNDSDMEAANNWIVGLGAPIISFAGGRMEVNFPAGTNAAIKLTNPLLIIGQKYELKAKVELIAGTSSRIQISSTFLSSPSSLNGALTRPLSGQVYHISQEFTAATADMWVGVALADNNGLQIAIDDVEVRKVEASSLELIERIDDTSRLLSSNLLDSYSSLIKSPSKWIQGTGDPTVNYNTSENSVSLDMLVGLLTFMKINNILDVSTEYTAKVTCKVISGVASKMFFGGISATQPGSDFFTPTNEFVEYNLTFTPNTTDLNIGCLAADNLGVNVEIKDIQVYVAATDESLDERVSSIERELVTGNILDSNSETMTVPTSWVGQIGAPTLDYATNPGTLTVDFGTGINRSVEISNPPLVIGQSYDIEVDLKVVGGVTSKITLGLFSSGSSEGNFIAQPTTDFITYKFSIIAENDGFGIGIAAANNNGTTLSIDNVIIKDRARRLSDIEHRVDDIESGGVGNPNQTGGTEGFMSSLSKYDKPLVKFCVAGDSLMGNYVGGAIPGGLDEGIGYRPIRLDINSVPRRIYDHIAFNKAEHRRIDVIEWVKNGAWTTVNDSTVWEPAHPDTLYHTSVNPNAYVEIAIPDGMENFALICQKDQGFGILDITLNGGDPSAYGLSTIDLARTRDSASDNGNPYYTVEYLNLPTGVNTIRVAKQNNVLECRVWGGFYWTGTTLVLHNIAHGGHSLKTLIDQHLNAEMLENNFDAILFELTIMNEMGQLRSPEQTVQDMEFIITTYAPNKDQMFMTPNPFGDNGSGTNYYANFPDPTMEDTSNACVKSLDGLGVPYVNCFDMFKKKIENRGGTLEGGEGGLYYTADGQHPNEDGCREWFNLVKPHVSNKPYNDS